MPWAELALPLSILFVKCILRLLVNREVSVPDSVAAILSLPVDIIFLSASLFAGYLIANTSSNKLNLATLVAYFGLSIITIWVWRISERLFTQEKPLLTALVGLINISLACGSLMYALSYLTAGGQK